MSTSSGRISQSRDGAVDETAAMPAVTNGQAPAAARSADPISQLRALREQADALNRRTGGENAPAVPAAAAAPVPPGDAARTAAPRPPGPATGPAAVAKASTARRTGRVRKARLRLTRIDPWSVMKVSFLLSIAAGVALFVAVAVLWSVLDAAGVFSSVDAVVGEITASDTNSGFDVSGFLSLSRVLGFTTMLAVVDVVLITALATLGAFLYNLAAVLLGGFEVTLAEDD